MMRLNHLLTLLFFTAALFLVGAATPLSVSVQPDLESDLSAALSHRLQTPSETQALTFDLFTPELDTAFTTPDGQTAVLWLALRDASGRLLATEPGLALARLSNEGWSVLLPGDLGWDETLAALPAGILPLEQSPAPQNASPDSVTVNALTGYYLPYAAGTSHRLEGSISHFQYLPELGYPSCDIAYCHFAYDFTDAGHYPLLASKDGTVFASRDSCTDGSTNCTNFIVLYNAGDHAYQLYLHMSHGTIPDKLTNGAQVRRGQYLGDTDDTGYSTSQHVHFMVVNTIWQGGDGYYWGYSIDVRFADVAINNGIPRNCYEVTHFATIDGATQCLGNKSDPTNPANDWFVSGNTGAYPPTGALSRPAAGATVLSGSGTIMDTTASVSDDVRVTAIRLVAKLDGQWVEIGPRVTQPETPGVYNWDVDLCAVGPLNGPLEVALRAWDYEGNVSSALSPRTIQVDYACPPPTSQLDPAQTFDSTAVHLSWTGSIAGAAQGSFELQWRTDSGVWDAVNTFSFPARQLSAWFAGQPGGSYAFRLRAIDASGQPEPWPADDALETSVSKLPSSCTADTFEPDNDLLDARILTLGMPAAGNLCGAGDPDWFKVDLEPGKDYQVHVTSQNGGAAAKLTIYKRDGEIIVASGRSAGVGRDAYLVFQVDASGSYYVELDPLTADLFGTDAKYEIVISEVKLVYLPQIVR